jgi:hypothetical protein
MNKLREAIAAAEHGQWGHWTRHMLQILDTVFAVAGVVQYENVDPPSPVTTSVRRWWRQIETPYDELSEKEKNSDREWADKVLSMMSGYAVVIGGSEAHYRLKEAGWSQMDEQPLDNLIIMEW